jgi:hypothetical protein
MREVDKMARLHIIYDPTDRLQTQPDMENRLKLKAASLSISAPEDLTDEEIHDIVVRLAVLLLEQVADR